MRLSRIWFPEDDENDVSWAAEWGLEDDPVGIEDSDRNLQQLVHDIVEDVRRWTKRYDLAIEWDLSGDLPAGKTIEQMVAEAGVTLPRTVTPATVEEPAAQPAHSSPPKVAPNPAVLGAVLSRDTGTARMTVSAEPGPVSFRR